ncbi:hypothetical protein K7432_007670 [Basidiobolus ranarum]|uniref:Peptide hydrolase n=1 Tax=Basidiobolus ranarum TaxID=34480 RepID=A0ABR2WSZ8_9FUNG
MFFSLVITFLALNALFGAFRGENKARLIRTAFNSTGEWLSESEVNELIRTRRRFMDITNGEMARVPINSPNYDIPSALIAQHEVQLYIKDIESALMTLALKHLTQFKNRYHNSEFGLAASEWLYQQLEYIISSNPEANVSLNYFTHSWMQKSIIVRFEAGTKSNSESIIVSGSLDSLNKWLPSTGVAPGADDSGSGAVSMLEAFRCLIDGSYKPSRSVEFHWYSGHAAGLIGSQDVARSYVAQSREVIGLLHSDMTGFTRYSNEVGVVTDVSDPDLSTLVLLIISEYTSLVGKAMKCEFACSDHLSWHLSGYRSTFQHESPSLDFNPFTRTGSDTIQNIDFSRMKEFTKVLIGFVIEMNQQIR